MSLREGSAIVAGAGPGVSGELTRLLVAEGRDIGLLGVEQRELDELARAAAEAGVRCETALVDLTDEGATRDAVAVLAAELAPLALVHFNPSAFREADPLVLTPDELAEDLALGVGSLLSVVQAARPFLAAGSRVSVTGSMAADEPWHVAASLGVQKAAVRNLVHSLDTALVEDGVRALSVTVRGTLAEEGPFARPAVAQAIRAALDTDEDDWASEVPYEG